MKENDASAVFSLAKQKLAQIKGHKYYIKTRDWIDKYLPTIARALVCFYFLNLAILEFEYYYSYGVPGFPWTALPLIPCTIAVFLNLKVHIFGSFVVFAALKDSMTITYYQLTRWLVYSQPLYINELMVKKFSTLGCMLLILASDPYFKEKIGSSAKALVGLIIKEDKGATSKKASIVLLTARLLISSLFLFVGYGEITRQMSQGIQHYGHNHDRPTGDGHDSMWPKLAEFALSLPFVVGFQTKNVSRLLAGSLLLEAIVYWQFWAPAHGLPFWYSTHARDHFAVNIGVAGGLLLFQTMGAGRYSVDALLKKKE